MEDHTDEEGTFREIPDKKLAFVGDIGVGKTSFIFTFIAGSFYDDTDIISPYQLQGFLTDFVIDETRIELDIRDSMEIEESAEKKKLYYSNASLIIICFSIDNHESFDDVEKKWLVEIQRYNFSINPENRVPIILIGLKTDLRDDPITISELKSKHLKPITKSEARKKADKIGAHTYLECSSRTNEGVQSAFADICKLILLRHVESEPTIEPVEKKQCLIV